ncbi:MAG: hypothetical protein K8T10_20305 [Candidatus Eremiobacteraeota bacterium]|nr:hypothetical protein [Candidatus Eremiobacteraeota bacterium]
MQHRIGIRREDKSEWEKRVPLTPAHVKKLIQEHDIQVYIQPSDIRIFSDEEYKKAGAIVQEDLSPTKTVIAVKELPEDYIKPGKTYVNFAHVIKGQSHNMHLLRKYMDTGSRLIDYEKITEDSGRRLIFFGNFAGLAGMVDSLWAFGKKMDMEGIKTPLLDMKQAYHYDSLSDIESAVSRIGERIKKEGIPEALVPMVCGFAGYGNVSGGAQHILDLLPTIEISPSELPGLRKREKLSNKHVYKVVFKEEHMAEPLDKTKKFDLQDYYDNPGKYRGIFHRHVPYLTILINAIYWSSRYPRLVTRDLMKRLYMEDKTKPPLKVIGDISVDVEGAIEFTTHVTQSGNPVYVFDPITENTTDGFQGDGIVVLAVDNLPCEIAREASEYFGEKLLPYIPEIVKEDSTKSFEESNYSPEIKRAVIVYNGKLTPDYKYLECYLQA